MNLLKLSVSSYLVDQRASTATEGRILLIAPRPPSEPSEENAVRDNKKKLQPHEMNADPDCKWQLWRDVNKTDAGRISGFPAGLGCCECCQQYDRECSCLASSLSFPRHATANQFFTPQMFTVYHREGFRICMDCDEFLSRAPASDPTGNEAATSSTTIAE
jgi:hypothetical protein